MPYLLLSLVWGRSASANPWNAKGLEWQTDSPPLPHNFNATPEVNEQAYAYGELDEQLHLPLDTEQSPHSGEDS
jgi:cytochrome c oxidase subunit 1